MDRWRGKVAVVTGASSGVGAATVKNLAIAGLTVVGLARRVERVEALKDSLPVEAASRLHAIRCDITKEEEIVRVFAAICERFGGVDALVNNAGIGRKSTVLEDGNGQDVRDIFNTNVVGLIHCSREAFQSMKSRAVLEGHIININSIAGHRVMDVPPLYVYGGSKFAVTALSEAMRYELVRLGSKIRVTSISPGMTKTEIVQGLPNLEQFSMLQPEDIADAIQYVLGLPPNVQVSELTIRATGEKVV